MPRTPRTMFPPQHSPKVMAPVNVHEIQAIAAKNVSHAVYEYASGGSEDDATLLGNLEAYRRTVLRRRVFVDVSNIDTTLDVLGQKLPFPILIAPASKNRVVPQGDKVAAIGAHAAKALYGIVGNAHSFIGEITKAGQAPSVDVEHARARHARGGERMGAAQRGGRRDVEQRHRRSSVHAESRQQHPQRLPRLRSRACCVRPRPP